MADYKELLRRAVEALPENNGAARRAVYEKARAALVGQLRAINPPLPARDITTHRLQLEDCIRQVEQEASEANIAGMVQDTPRLPPVFAAEGRKASEPRKPAPKAEAQPELEVEAEDEPEPPAKPERAKRKPDAGASIEDIIAAADFDGEEEEPAPAPSPETKSRPGKGQPILVARNDAAPTPKSEPRRPSAPRHDSRPLPSIVARAEAAKGRAVPSFGANLDGGRRAAVAEARHDGRAPARRIEPEEYEVDEGIEAMAAVREVELEPQSVDPQGTIDRAIATLDREARGEPRFDEYDEPDLEYDDEPVPQPKRQSVNGKANGRATGTDLVVAKSDRFSRPRERSVERQPAVERDAPPASRSDRGGKRSRPAKEFANPRRAQASRAFDGLPRTQPERRGLGAVAIFGIVFAALMVGAGGAGFWAYQEGYLDNAFGRATPPAATAVAEAPGPGNTEAPAPVAEPATQMRADDRLPATTTAAATPAEPLALQSPVGGQTGERLAGASQVAEQAVAAIDTAALTGSQSLLLEASDNSSTGAVPFSGTVDWTKGVDEVGQPTLVGKANIPARNLSVDILIRKNSDPSLPASHLMEINFGVSDTFIGGSIAGLPGVLLKNEELVQGTPLVGASARVVGHSFLFALSATPQDSATNSNLLTSRKWMDLALIYASGKRAIITLEKDAAADALFKEVFASWSPPTASSAG